MALTFRDEAVESVTRSKWDKKKLNWIRSGRVFFSLFSWKRESFNVKILRSWFIRKWNSHEKSLKGERETHKSCFTQPQQPHKANLEAFDCRWDFAGFGITPGRWIKTTSSKKPAKLITQRRFTRLCCQPLLCFCTANLTLSPLKDANTFARMHTGRLASPPFVDSQHGCGTRSNFFKHFCLHVKVLGLSQR